jgi:putative ABC transport system permease protein
MRLADLFALAAAGVVRSATRTVLLMIAVAIGVVAVITLSALGEGARRYVQGEFAAIGTNLVIVIPGRNETRGGAPPLTGETPRDLTLDDALALPRHPSVQRVAPMQLGLAQASVRERSREVVVIGTTPEFHAVRHVPVGAGRPLPSGDPRRAAPVAVLGPRVAAELIPHGSPMGEWLRLGDRRFRVIGVLAPTGTSLGVDLDDTVLVPVASAHQLFDSRALIRILVEAASRDAIGETVRAVTEIIRLRHDGEEDITVITQDAVLATFDRILRALTLTVAGIAAISLAVAGILIMNVTWVAVSQRTAEIGVLKAIGADRAAIRNLFLAEAALLSASGATAGLVLGLGAVTAGRALFPQVPFAAPGWAVAGAIVIAIGTGVAFAVGPARRAARLDPVAALGKH